MNKLIILLISLSITVFGANYTSTTSGLFSAGTTWVGGTAPSVDGDTWTIASTHTVVYDLDNSAMANGWGACTNNGTLYMSNSMPSYFKINGSFYGSASGIWKIGDVANPMTFKSDGSPGAVIDVSSTTSEFYLTNASPMQFYGDVKHLGYVRIASNSLAGDFNLITSNTSLVLTSNDIIYIGRTDIQGSGNEMYVVASFTNNVLIVQTNPVLWSTYTNRFYPQGADSRGLFTVKGTLPNTRYIGSFVVSPNLPILFKASVDRRSTPIIHTASGTNGVYVGVRLHYLPFYAFSIPTAYQYSIVVSNCSETSDGYWAYGTVSIKAYNCVQLWDGRLAYANNAGYYSNCIVACNFNGLASSGGIMYADSCTVINGAAGFGNALRGSATLINCSAYSTDRILTGAIGNVYFENLYAYYVTSFDGWNSFDTVYRNCTITNCGVLVYNVCSGIIFDNCSITPLPYAMCSDLASSDVLTFNTPQSTGWQSGASQQSNLLPTLSNPFGLICHDYVKFFNLYGSTTFTNNQFVSQSQYTNGIVAYYLPFSIKSGSIRQVQVSMLLTNNVTYSIYYCRDYGFTKPSPTSDLIFTSQVGNNIWTNFTFSVSNTNSMANNYKVFVTSTDTTTNELGISYVTFGNDNTTTRY